MRTAGGGENDGEGGKGDLKTKMCGAAMRTVAVRMTEKVAKAIRQQRYGER